MTTGKVFRDPNPEYWDNYSNLQRVKHALVKRYLEGWFPKIIQGPRPSDVLYLDTHAGRGRHATGEIGSPLVALRSLLDHRVKDRLLALARCHFYFIEKDPANLAALQAELGTLSWPNGVVVNPMLGDFETQLAAYVAQIRKAGAQVAPAFVFVDPYSFKIPWGLLSEFMAMGRVELFVNVIWHELDLALLQAKGGSAPEGTIRMLTGIFAGDGWRTIIAGEDIDQRAMLALGVVRALTHARWATHMRMLGRDRRTRYLLVHLTNSPDGRDLMKECLWRVCPDGQFYAGRHEDLRQQVLITPEPDLAPLRAWLLEQIRGTPKRWSRLADALRETLWLESHMNSELRQLRDGGIIGREPDCGRFGPKANHSIFLSSEGGAR